MNYWLMKSEPDEFSIDDWRKHKNNFDAKEFARSSTFIPMKPFAQTRSNIKEIQYDL